MNTLEGIIKKAFFSGFKKYAEEIGVEDPAKLLNPGSAGDAPEIQMFRRGWPDPLKRAKKLHETMQNKNKGGLEDVKEKAQTTKHSPEVTVG